MEIKSIREFLSWVDQKVFFLDENEGSVCLKSCLYFKKAVSDGLCS